MTKRASSLCYAVAIIAFFIVFKHIPFHYLFEHLSTDPDISDWLGKMLANLLLSLLAYRLLAARNQLKIAGINSPRTYAAWSYLLLLPFLFLFTGGGIFNIGEALEGVSFSKLLPFTLYMISIGLVEEFVFRGVIQSCFLSSFSNDKLAVVSASILFALIHFYNFFTVDTDLQPVTNQVFFAANLGLLMGAVLYVTRNIWPIVIYHFLVDFFAHLPMLESAEAVVQSTTETSSPEMYPIASIILTFLFYSIPGIAGWVLLVNTEERKIE
jgi:hypothetical protein